MVHQGNDLTQVVFPPHVGDAIGFVGLALFALYVLAIWLIVDWIREPNPKKRK